MKQRMSVPGLLILALGLLFAGCAEQDTGDRRIDMYLWTYNPPQPVEEGSDVLMDSEIFVRADERWSGYFSDSYIAIEDAEVLFNDDRLPFRAAVRGYSDVNVPLPPGEKFDLQLELSAKEHYGYSGRIPEVVIGGLPTGVDTTLSVNDTLRINWLEIPGAIGYLDILLNQETVESYSHRKVFRWSPDESYRGKRITMYYHLSYTYNAPDPFNVMQYEYVSRYYVDVE